MTKSYGKGVRVAALGLATATVLSLAAPAFAAGAKPQAKGPENHAGSGLMAAIDPATGKLRQPTAAETRALSAGIQEMTKASADKLQLKQFADGTMSMNLGTAFLNISLVQVQPDGTLREYCVDSANAVLSTTPAFEDK
jgi:hypothetical protein